jgi:amino acid transporter
VLIVTGAAVALANDLPAMLLAVSRLMFAWAEDGVFPRGVAAVHPRRHTPHVALVLSGAMASASILGSHFAGDFFLGVDILVTSMLVNFIVMCLSVIRLPHRAPDIAREVTVLRSRALQVPLAWGGVALLGLFLCVHVVKDLRTEMAAWYFRSTWLWVLVLALASVISLREVRKLRRDGVDLHSLFATLPPE